MRLHIGILGAVVVLFAAWLLFGPREKSPDLVRARDRLVASDAITVRFDPGGVGGYQFTSIKGEGWLWERTDASGKPYPDAIAFNGRDHLLRVAEGCYIQVKDFRPPLIPGVTVSPRLARQPGLHERAGSNYVYAVSPSFSARQDYPSSLPALEITEDLSRLRADATVLASTGSSPDYIWRGDYRINAATAADIARARGVLREARPSDYAEIVLIDRVIGNILGNVISDPSSVVIAQDCPESPARLWPGSHGAQAEGLRATPLPFTVVPGDHPVFRDAHATTMSIRAPSGFLNELFENAPYEDVPVSTAQTVIIHRGEADGLAVFILSCTAKPWFRC